MPKVARSSTISADVKSGESARRRVGQDGIPPLLDIVVPMTYNEYRNPDDITKPVTELHSRDGVKTVIVALRGWAINQTSKSFIGGGLGRNRTAVYSFCRGMPYYLATRPL